MKRCTKCSVEKPLEEFPLNKTGKHGRSSHCKQCRREYESNRRKEHRKAARRHYWKHRKENLARQKKYREENREAFRARSLTNYYRRRMKWLKIISDKFGGWKCSICGYNKCEAAIDFHHSDPTNKEISIGNLKYLAPTESRIKELDKVTMLCRNCHAELHNNKEQWIF